MDLVWINQANNNICLIWIFQIIEGILSNLWEFALKKLFINRYLLESLSGVLTGSIYHDGGMAKKFVGELGKFEINENATNTYVSQNKF